MSRLVAAAILALRFLGQVVVSGVTTARLILGGSARLRPGLVRIAYAPMSERGTALLGALITLTPGTTVVEIDPARREMLLHLLDTGAEGAIRAAIRDDLERYVVALCPPGG